MHRAKKAVISGSGGPTHFLFFGCFTSLSGDAKSRCLLKIDLASKHIHLFRKGERKPFSSLPFLDILCVQRNVKYERGITVYPLGNTATPPLNLFVDSVFDRDDLEHLISVSQFVFAR